jgi:predicted DCC family thiol-disulfide oxidoreductase YuxK
VKLARQEKSTAASRSPAMAARVPPAIRAFHFPGSRGSFAAGTLKVSGLASFLFPRSPVAVVVRTRALPGEQVEWLRCFGGKKYFASTYLWSGPSKHLDLDAPQPLHDVEAVFPLRFHLDWNSSALEAGSGGGVLSSNKGKTTFLGTNITLPKPLAQLNLDITMHDDGGGWHLRAVVSSLRLQVLSFSGPMRFIPDAHDVASGARYVEGFHHIVMFDGHCNLCNASVDFIIRNDPRSVFIFVPQQSPKAAALLESIGVKPPPLVAGDKPMTSEGTQDSVILLTPDGRLHERAAATLHCLAALAWPWSWLARVGLLAAALLPSSAIDKVYKAVGRNRYKWFGRTQTCRVPTAADKSRFL